MVLFKGTGTFIKSGAVFFNVIIYVGFNISIIKMLIIIIIINNPELLVTVMLLSLWI